jgi:hypothetical protein
MQESIMKSTIRYSMSIALISAVAGLSIAAWDDSSTASAAEAVKSLSQATVVAGRISYWQGKVNVHTDPTTSIWTSDADCTSGAEINKLTYCKKFYPNTISVTSVPLSKKPPMLWNTAGCGQQYTSDGVEEFTCNVAAPPRISYWQGKVNLHRDSGGSWTKDSDCTSGAGIDPLVYCKKFYPATTSVTSVPVTTKPELSWNTAGCRQQYSGDGLEEFTCNP